MVFEDHAFGSLRSRGLCTPFVVRLHASSACCWADFTVYATPFLPFGAGEIAEVRPESVRRTVLVTMARSAFVSG
jgi:hypothetical protein